MHRATSFYGFTAGYRSITDVLYSMNMRVRALVPSCYSVTKREELNGQVMQFPGADPSDIL